MARPQFYTSSAQLHFSYFASSEQQLVLVESQQGGITEWSSADGAGTRTMSECGVCQQIIQKARVHYEGVSCYSCRAFFRRNTQREDIPPCKERGQCVITYTDRKLCTDCRYQKCLG